MANKTLLRILVRFFGIIYQSIGNTQDMKLIQKEPTIMHSATAFPWNEGSLLRRVWVESPNSCWFPGGVKIKHVMYVGKKPIYPNRIQEESGSSQNSLRKP